MTENTVVAGKQRLQMQMLYSISAIAVVLILLNFDAGKVGERAPSDSRVVAEQMYHWHSSAFDQCASTVCKSGVITPDEHLSLVLQSGDKNGAAKFVSRFNESSGVLETRLSNSMGENEGLAIAVISAELQSIDPNQAVRSGMKGKQAPATPPKKYSSDSIWQTESPETPVLDKADANQPVLVSVISNGAYGSN